MKTKRIEKILICTFIIIVLFSLFKLKSKDISVSSNSKKLEDNLRKSINGGKGICKNVFTFDYDKVYIFQPYLSKDDMEKDIGFEYSKLKESVNEGMVNILFVNENSPIVYLYGYPSQLGYYIDIPIGVYNKYDLEKAKYTVNELEVGNSSSREGYYNNYIIYIDK